MPKMYRYRNLTHPLADNEEAHFTVKFISDGNTGPTNINVPGPDDKVIEDEGTVSLGTGNQLRSEKTVSVSVIANPVPTEDEIRIQYLINGDLLVEHVNAKAEEERPIIILYIDFPKP
jgi:hypothetical protein